MDPAKVKTRGDAGRAIKAVTGDVRWAISVALPKVPGLFGPRQSIGRELAASLTALSGAALTYPVQRSFTPLGPAELVSVRRLLGRANNAIAAATGAGEVFRRRGASTFLDLTFEEIQNVAADPSLILSRTGQLASDVVSGVAGAAGTLTKPILSQVIWPILKPILIVVAGVLVLAIVVTTASQTVQKAVLKKVGG
jgi:hypothetical protein